MCARSKHTLCKYKNARACKEEEKMLSNDLSKLARPNSRYITHVLSGDNEDTVKKKSEEYHEGNCNGACNISVKCCLLHIFQPDNSRLQFCMLVSVPIILFGV